MARKSSISRLPPAVKAHIERRLAEGRMTLDELIADLHESFPAAAVEGDLPSRSAVQRYGAKLEKRLSAIRASTEAAKIIRNQIDDSEDARSEALTALVQTELFETILMLQEATDEDVDPTARVKMLGAAAKNIATLTRSSVNLKKFQGEIEAAARQKLIEEQRGKLAELGRTGEVDAGTLDKVIKAAYGL